jgi:hypothetical protein
MNGSERRRVALGCRLASALLLGSAFAQARKPQLVAPRQAAAEPVPYPEDAHGEARVVLELVIAQDGSVADVTLRAGREPFVSAARIAVARWQVQARHPRRHADPHAHRGPDFVSRARGRAPRAAEHGAERCITGGRGGGARARTLRATCADRDPRHR